MLKRRVVVYLVLIFLKNTFAKPEFLKTKDKGPIEILNSLTLREKIGQLFVVATASNFSQPTEILASSMQQCPYNLKPSYIKELIKNYNIGGLIFLYKSDPITQKKFIDKYQKLSKMPLLIAQDCECGLSMRLDLDPSKVITYPKNIELGKITNKKLIYKLGKEIGRQCAVIGVHMNLAPVVDINTNPNNPVIKDRSFGSDKKIVTECSNLYAQGLHDAGILSCAKHFPGHGDTNIDSHLDLPIINHDISRLESIELYPFKELISKNIPAIMTAHITTPALDSSNKPASLSYDIITKKLKNNMGFKGLVITDGLGMQALTKYYKPGEIELQAFLAGNDILLCPLNVPLAIDLIEKVIKSGLVSELELNNRVLKILKAKDWVFEQHKKYQNISSNINSIESFLVRHQAVALQKKLIS